MPPSLDISSRAYTTAKVRAQIDGYSRYLEREASPPPGLFIQAFGEIGEGKAVNAASIRRKLNIYSAERQIEVAINSPGGKLQEARKIYALLRGSGKHVSTRVVGQCSSAASIILLAGDWREANSTSLFCLHDIELDPERGLAAAGRERWTAELHSKVSNLMRQENSKLEAFYSGRTGKPLHLFQQAMRSEKRLTADEAAALGLVHNVLDPLSGRMAAASSK